MIGPKFWILSLFLLLRADFLLGVAPVIDCADSFKALLQLGYSENIAQKLSERRPGTVARILQSKEPALSVFRGINLSWESLDPHRFNNLRDSSQRFYRGLFVSPDPFEALSYAGPNGILLEFEVPRFIFRDPENISQLNPAGFWQGVILAQHMSYNYTTYLRRFGIVNRSICSQGAQCTNDFIQNWLPGNELEHLFSLELSERERRLSTELMRNSGNIPSDWNVGGDSRTPLPPSVEREPGWDYRGSD